MILNPGPSEALRASFLLFFFFSFCFAFPALSARTATPVIPALLPLTVGHAGGERLADEGVSADILLGADAADAAATIATTLLARAVRLTAGWGDALSVDITGLAWRARAAPLTTLDVLARVGLRGVLHA